MSLESRVTAAEKRSRLGGNVHLPIQVLRERADAAKVLKTCTEAQEKYGDRLGPVIFVFASHLDTFTDDNGARHLVDRALLNQWKQENEVERKT